MVPRTLKEKSKKKKTFRKLQETFSRSIRELSYKDLKCKHGKFEWGGLGFLYSCLSFVENWKHLQSPVELIHPTLLVRITVSLKI